MNSTAVLRFALLVALLIAGGGCAEMMVGPPPGAGPYPPYSPGPRRPVPGHRLPPEHREPRPMPPQPVATAGQDYVVRLREGVSATAFARRHGLTLRRTMQSDAATAVYRGSGEPAVLERLRSDREVIWAEPDSAVQMVPLQ